MRRTFTGSSVVLSFQKCRKQLHLYDAYWTQQANDEDQFTRFRMPDRLGPCYDRRQE